MQHVADDLGNILAGSPVHTFQHGGSLRGDLGAQIFEGFTHGDLSQKMPRAYWRGEPRRLVSLEEVADLSGLPAGMNKKAQPAEGVAAGGQKARGGALREKSVGVMRLVFEDPPTGHAAHDQSNMMCPKCGRFSAA